MQNEPVKPEPSITQKKIYYTYCNKRFILTIDLCHLSYKEQYILHLYEDPQISYKVGNN